MFLTLEGRGSARQRLATFALVSFAVWILLQALSSTLQPLSAQAVSPVACAPDSGLLAYWKLDEGTGTSTADSTGNGHTGTLQNGTAWTTAVAPTGFINPNAASFDGVDDEITAPDTLLELGTQSFTVSLFAKTTVGDRSVLGHYDNQSGFRGWGLYFYGNGNVNFFGYGNMGVNDTSKPAPTLLNGQWHHVAGVYTRTGNSLKIETFVDGISVGTNTVTVGDISIDTPMRLGHYLFQPTFAGSLDDVRIYDSALSAAQIMNLKAGNCGYFCNGKVATIVGTSGDDLLNGTAGNDVIVTLGGNDIAQGLGGADDICIGDGNDVGNGGNGNDWVDGGKGNDALNGNDGADKLFGGAGNDAINGGNGVDQVNGGADSDACNGEVVAQCEA